MQNQKCQLKKNTFHAQFLNQIWFCHFWRKIRPLCEKKWWFENVRKVSIAWRGCLRYQKLAADSVCSHTLFGLFSTLTDTLIPLIRTCNQAEEKAKVGWKNMNPLVFCVSHDCNIMWSILLVGCIKKIKLFDFCTGISKALLSWKEKEHIPFEIFYTVYRKSSNTSRPLIQVPSIRGQTIVGPEQTLIVWKIFKSFQNWPIWIIFQKCKKLKKFCIANANWGKKTCQIDVKKMTLPMRKM